jgi:hypothetical protein
MLANMVNSIESKDQYKYIDSNFNNKPNKRSDKKLDGILFHYGSEYQQSYLNTHRQQASAKIDKASLLLNPPSYGIYSNYLNISPGRRWFNENLSFIFSQGCVWDEDDNKQINALLEIFIDNGRNGFLKNTFRVMSYNDDIIKDLERMIAVKNGNYHILLIVFVNTAANISEAPEPDFSREGIIEHFLDWQHVMEYISIMGVRYGLLSNIRAHSPESLKKENAMKYTSEISEDDRIG